MLDQKVAKRTKDKEYFQYLVKCKKPANRRCYLDDNNINFQVWHKH